MTGKLTDMSTDRKLLLLTGLMCVAMLFLFLGQSEFNTRGEPREALVAYAMLEQGNWVLPMTNGVDMAYKPPMFHWMIAVLSAVWGSVTEYTSRMPSALALTAMTLSLFLFYRRRRGAELAFLTAAITLTNFEVHRAGVNCRVDMVLSALMVMALLQLFRWCERGLRGVPWTAILLMSGAMLTKGPVGIVLPCMVTGAFLLLRGTGFWRTLLSLSAVGVASLVLPMVWYVAAWRQGGDSFLQLVMEENVLRFLGKMSYSSHENPVYYNVLTMVAGFVPYTLLVLMSLPFLRWRRPGCRPAAWWDGLKRRVRQMDDTRLFTLLSFALIFVFYCIPKSKRSVYLLPCYPFLAYFLAEYILYVVRGPLRRVVRAYALTLCGLGVVLTLAFVAVKCGAVPHDIFHGRHAADNLAYLQAVENIPLSPGNLLLVVLPLVPAAVWLFCRRRGPLFEAYVSVAAACLVFMALDGVYQPAVLNVKSNKPVAERIAAIVPQGTVYSYITLTNMGDRMHTFSINFYLGDRVVPFVDFRPSEGYLIMGEREYDGFVANYASTYTLEEVFDSGHRSCDDKDVIHFYHFEKKD